LESVSMVPKPEEEGRIRDYLLGDLPQEEQQQFEERLLAGDDLVDRLMLVEDELIDDYLFGALSSHQRERFEDHFLKAPGRRRKLELARQLVKYASSWSAAVAPVPTEEPRDELPDTTPALWIRIGSILIPWHHWRQWRHGMKIAAYATIAAILIGLGLWGGRDYLFQSPIDAAMSALNQAYREGRPVEARITGFSYAEFKSAYQRGGQADGGDKVQELKPDYLALERAKRSLSGANPGSSDPAVLHALGKYYLTQQEFDRAIEQLEKALVYDPNNARLHSDLGAALLGRVERDRFMTGRRSSEDVAACLEHLNRALALAPSLPEAIFNRALLYHGERLRREAREAWERYRQLDPNSPWGREASENLQTIEIELRK
jgi:tetratricopeptide (TPR) repeat protein